MTNKEAIVWLKECKEHYGEYHEMCDKALDIAIKALEEIPQGEWIRHIRSIECSVCKNKFFADDENENCQDYEPCIDFNFKYCPNCGAKMTKEAENE